MLLHLSITSLSVGMLHVKLQHSSPAQAWLHPASAACTSQALLSVR